MQISNEKSASQQLPYDTRNFLRRTRKIVHFPHSSLMIQQKHTRHFI